MKNLFKISFAIITLGLFYTCDDGIEEVQVAQALQPAVVETDQTVIDLLSNENLPDNPALTLVWQDVDYGVQAVPDYEIQFSSDQAFTNPVSVTVTKARTITWTVRELNVEAQKAGLAVEEEGTMYIRIISTLGASNNTAVPVESNVVAVNVIPYFSYIFKDYYLVGAATQPGWENNNNNPPLFRTEEDPNVYRYTGFFNSDEFKVLEILGLWQPQWGSNDGTTLAGNPATQGGDPGTFVISGAAGYYTFSANFNNLSYTIEPFDASGATTFSTIELTGSAGSVTLTQSSFDQQIWYANGVDLSSGTAQFVTNTGATWGGANEFHGRATEGATTIPITERNYNIWFNSLTGDYMIIPTF